MINRSSGADFPKALRDNIYMRQMSLFSRAEIAAMRDRTASRNYSPEMEEFRREHKIRRAFGKARRHEERDWRVLAGSRDPRKAPVIDESRNGLRRPRPSARAPQADKSDSPSMPNSRAAPTADPATIATARPGTPGIARPRALGPAASRTGKPDTPSPDAPRPSAPDTR
ncbi:hypothetical protein [Actinoplanes sp. NPDC026619]|uniref:hypothetical protein n=1 Tax=Actinoplanes sp. NPDC026619 TaxID=3155798 RepID=UPI0033EC2192